MKELVAIVEDEPDLLANLEFNLSREGYRTRSAQNGAAGLVAIESVPHPDVIILDLMLPDMQGTEICRKIRSNSRTKDIPVLMLTARGDEIDRIVGFEVGADDYVVKPYSVRELMLRVRALLRRRAGKVDPTSVRTFGLLRLDTDAHRIWVKDAEIVLTALEFRLLETFLERRGRVQTRDTLLSDVWGIDAEVTTRTVDTHVKRLRQKLGAAGDYIETLRGVGYRMRAKPDEVGA